MNQLGAQQRAELFANVDELMAWKKSFDAKQRELLEWQAGVEDAIKKLNERIDMVNKRLRLLETRTKRIRNETRQS